MHWLLTVFSTRELAIGTWLIILILLSLLSGKIRSAYGKLITISFNPKLFIPQCLLLLYVAAIVCCLYRLRLWDLGLLKDTCLWVVFSALVIFYNLGQAKSGGFFIGLLKESVKFIVLYEFLFNTYTFSFTTEMIAIPLLTFLVTTQVFAEHSSKKKPEDKKIATCLNNVMAILGFCFFVYTIYETVIHFIDLWSLSVLKELLLPIVLLILTIPCFYLVALFMRYETLHVLIKRPLQKRDTRYGKEIRILILLYGNLSLTRVSRITNKLPRIIFIDDIDHKSCIKKIVLKPLHKRVAIGSNMLLAPFNNIEGVRKSLSSLEWGGFGEWDSWLCDDEFECKIKSYSLSQTYTNDITCQLKGKETYITTIELTLNVFNKAEKKSALSEMGVIASAMFGRLYLIMPPELLESIKMGVNYKKEFEDCILDFNIDKCGETLDIYLLSVISK